MRSDLSLLDRALDPDYWRSLNPNMHVDDNPARPSQRPGRFSAPASERLLRLLKREGYAELPHFFPAAKAERAAKAVKRLVAKKWPAVFAFVYRDFWELFQDASEPIRASLGPGYQQLPDFWAWHVRTSEKDGGAGPHRDRDYSTVSADGTPKSLTVWLALTPSIPLNGCIYLLPAHLDPRCNTSSEPIDTVADLLNRIRAIPAAQGSAILWNQALLHWGGKSSTRAREPRISIAFEFQSGLIAPLNQPLIDPCHPPAFRQRLHLIAKQLFQYRHMYPLVPSLERLAQFLQEEPTSGLTEPTRPYRSASSPQ